MEQIKELVERYEDILKNQKQRVFISDLNKFIEEKTIEYCGIKNFNQRIMIDINGINVITVDENDSIIDVDCKENI